MILSDQVAYYEIIMIFALVLIYYLSPLLLQLLTSPTR
jgi:hypothetical protein